MVHTMLYCMNTMYEIFDVNNAQNDMLIWKNQNNGF